MKALWGDEPATFEGEHFQLRDAECYPKPVQRPLPLLVGGGGERRTLRIVAEHADVWNVTGVDVEGYRHKREVLERHCADVGRDPSEIRHTQMAAFVIGRDDPGLRQHLGRIVEKLPQMGQRGADETLEWLKRRGWLVGTPGELVDEIGRREEAGLTRTMLQHHANDHFEVLELIASDVLPQVQR